MSGWNVAVEAAAALHRELAKLGVDSALYAGVSPPAVSMWGGIVVQVDGETYTWINAARCPAQYASVPADQPCGAARQVAARHAELAKRQQQPLAWTAVPS